MLPTPRVKDGNHYMDKMVTKKTQIYYTILSSEKKG